MPNRVNVPVIDASDEVSTVSIIVTEPAPVDGDITAFFDAIDGVSIGTLRESILTNAIQKDVGSSAIPANKFAQRELKWLCKYTDNTTLDRFRFEVPCADASLLGTSTDFLDLSAGAGLALKTAFQAIARSKNGNAVTLNSVELVGRNT